MVFRRRHGRRSSEKVRRCSRCGLAVVADGSVGVVGSSRGRDVGTRGCRLVTVAVGENRGRRERCIG
jgi:hypothetical protein